MDTVLKIPPDWLTEFEAAARRPLEQRLRYEDRLRSFREYWIRTRRG
jgi:hypothetical protein